MSGVTLGFASASACHANPMFDNALQLYHYQRDDRVQVHYLMVCHDMPVDVGICARFARHGVSSRVACQLTC